MLVLQRKKGQVLLVGENIRISIIETATDGVKLAIDAPRDVKILREELVEAEAVNRESVANLEKLQKVRALLSPLTPPQ